MTTTDQMSRLPATPESELEHALSTLTASKAAWLRVSPARRVELLEELLASFMAVAERWVDASVEAEGIPPANPMAGEEWLAGPYLVIRNLRLLHDSLADITRGKRPALPGSVRTLPNGQVAAQVFPTSSYDRVLFSGVTAEVWMEPGVSEDSLPETQALAYFGTTSKPCVSLVLGAGNVSSIGPTDALYKLFVENKVVLFKVHPVNDYLGPLLAEGFAPLVERGFLAVVYGGAAEGAYLCAHPAVDEIHITGSDKTVEAIVFGPGEEGRQRKAERRPLLTKPISSELGNVSPVIVVPGPWTRADIAYHAENLATMLANNAGFNCNAARVIVTQAGWTGRVELLEALRAVFSRHPTRRAYYPGAVERWKAFVAAHPEAELFGESSYGRLPWTLIPHLDPDRHDDICFSTEPFAPVIAEVPLAADSTEEFLAAAVAFANERLWGTLNAGLIVHPETARTTHLALERAVSDLRYGTVAINHWAAIGFGLISTPWGAFPGATLNDIQSGTGWVHNTYMFERAQKVVLSAPFRARPKPPWFLSHQNCHKLGRALTEFEASPSPWKLPGIFALALGG